MITEQNGIQKWIHEKITPSVAQEVIDPEQVAQMQKENEIAEMRSVLVAELRKLLEDSILNLTLDFPLDGMDIQSLVQVIQKESPKLTFGVERGLVDPSDENTITIKHTGGEFYLTVLHLAFTTPTVSEEWALRYDDSYKN